LFGVWYSTGKRLAFLDEDSDQGAELWVSMIAMASEFFDPDGGNFSEDRRCFDRFIRSPDTKTGEEIDPASAAVAQ
jgi:hypothetical protein